MTLSLDLGIHTEKEYVDLYLSRTNMELESEWDFYIIFSLFKVAAISQGILGRVRDGTAASDFAVEMGKRAKSFADLGWEKAKEYHERIRLILDKLWGQYTSNTLS